MDLGSAIDSSSAMNDNPSSPSKKLKHTQNSLALGPGKSSIEEGNDDPSKSFSTGLNGPDYDNNNNDDDDGDDIADDDDDDDMIDDDDDDDDDNDDDEYYAFDDNEGVYENTSEHNEYEKMQSQFDNVDLPPGVEASFSWLNGSSPKETITATKSLTIADLPGSSSIQSDPPAQIESSASSSKTPTGQSSSRQAEADSEISTSRFEVVASFSDHHYETSGFNEKQAPKNWAKKIQEEWRILSSDLPDTIYVRVCEARMELLRAVLVGPQGTPYHDGLFVFDCLFPIDYPNSPPLVYYYSGGLRLNPNLYDCGKVCLSLLGTWDGHKNERWIPKKSTMLQVLVSIQALILNEKPFFNEPGHERFMGPEGESRYRRYNEEVFILSLKTMIYTLRRPPQHFEELVANHFRDRARTILLACKAYTEGVSVGEDIDGPKVVNENEEICIKEFKSKVASMMKLLAANFTRNGSTDCEEFRVTAS